MSITLNNSIYTLLVSSTGLTAIVGTKIFPVLIPPETLLPAIVIERDFSTEYHRDGAGINESNVEIAILSQSYNQSVQIAVLVDGILNNYKGTVSNNRIVDTHLVSADEGYQEDAFLQKLIYVMKNY